MITFYKTKREIKRKSLKDHTPIFIKNINEELSLERMIIANNIDNKSVSFSLKSGKTIFFFDIGIIDVIAKNDCYLIIGKISQNILSIIICVVLLIYLLNLEKFFIGLLSFIVFMKLVVIFWFNNKLSRIINKTSKKLNIVQ